jgi:hypothetical protein
MTRGGAGEWYRDFASGSVDVFDLLSPEEYLPRLVERQRRAGDLKQLRVDRFDRELVALARERCGELAVVHPGLMFTRLRGLWFKGRPLAEVRPRLEYRRLEIPDTPVAGLPERYVAVKAYFNQCLPRTPETSHFLRRTIDRLAEGIDVVLLSTGLLVDDHEEWATSHPRVHPIEEILRPEDNLSVQARVVARARGLVATYGGFSYLGPFLDVPTLTFAAVEQTVPVHLDVLRAARPDAAYGRATAGDLAAVEHFASDL